MRYPNATRGVRLLLISHGLQLALALFQTLLALVFPVISYQYALSPVFGWINRALALGALVLMLLGILLARRDEEAFRPALVPVCVLLGGVFVFNILPSFWSSAFSSGVLMWGFYAYLFLSTLLYLWAWLSMTDGEGPGPLRKTPALADSDLLHSRPGAGGPRDPESDRGKILPE